MTAIPLFHPQLGIVQRSGEMVEDQGPGVPPEAIETLFAEVSADSSALYRRMGGLGLGLAATRKIIEALAGTVGYEPREGGGSRFWFDVPFERAHHKDIAP